MKSSLWREHVLPFTLLLGLLAAATLAGDYVLHRLDLVWVGRYMGIPGTLLIIGSLYYSARKRKWVTTGDPKSLLTMHEFGTWLGSLMVLIHAGIHFNALLPWLAILMLLITVASGLIGKDLLKKANETLKLRRSELIQSGLSVEETDKELFLDSITVDLMKKWRIVHMPITLLLAFLVLMHIISVLMFSK